MVTQGVVIHLELKDIKNMNKYYYLINIFDFQFPYYLERKESYLNYENENYIENVCL